MYFSIVLAAVVCTDSQNESEMGVLVDIQ